MGMVDIEELQRTLLFVVGKLQELQGPPAERNMWWRRPIPGLPENTTFQSFCSLKRRDVRQRGHWGVSTDHEHNENTVDYTVGDSGENQECEAECLSNVSDLISPYDVIEMAVASECELEDDFQDSVEDTSVQSEIIATSDCSQNELIQELDNLVCSSVNGSVTNDMSCVGIECDRDTVLYPMATSSPAPVGQRCEQESASKVCSVLGGETMDTHHQPLSGETQWSPADKKPPSGRGPGASHVTV